MIDLDGEEVTILAAARAGLSPTDADAHRVRHGIHAAIAAGAGVAAGTAVAGLNSTVVRSTGRLTRWLLVSAFAGSTGVTGYWMGHRAGVHDATTIAPGEVEARATKSLAEEVAAPVALPTTSPVVTSSEPARRAHDPQPARNEVRVRRIDSTRPSTDKAPVAGAASLDKEVEALRAIERALRDKQPSLALALIGQLDRELPHGQLTEEREALSAIARCVLDAAPFDVDLARDFAERHANSVYLKRIQQACQGPGASREPRD